MGLFASRPEEPQEWAGLPSEPVEPGMPGERLEAASAASCDALSLVAGNGESIVIPLTVSPEIALTPAEAADGGPERTLGTDR